MKEQKLVSIIVPVYNVEKYLDKCLLSLVKQTYKDIEIIIIKGKSSDRSNEIATEWCRKDKRIKSFEEERKGLSAARNQGILLAKGEYIIFVDSDDWVENEFVERLYHAVEDNGADFAECDFYRARNYSEKKELVRCNSMMDREFSRYERAILGGVTAWKYITKREFWIESGLRYPECSSEDMATYLPIILMVNKIQRVDGYLYAYRKDRDGNLCSDKTNHINVAQAFDQLITNLKQHQVYNDNRTIISAYIRRWLSRTLSPCVGKIEEKDIASVIRGRYDIYRKYFNDKVYSECCLGGFNISRILNKLPFIENPFGRINFASMISICDDRKLNISIHHKNAYRNEMLRLEKDRLFFQRLRSNEPDYFFFDLLEERHDIIELKDGYMTKSDAYDQCEIDNTSIVRTIERDSEECRILWEKSCDKFMATLFAIVNPANVYMLETYLCTEHGNGKTISQFDDLDQINKTNRILSEYYSYIRKKYPEIKVVEAYKADNFVSDDEYEFGCYPWHLNEWANIEIAKMLVNQEQDGILYSVL